MGNVSRWQSPVFRMKLLAGCLLLLAAVLFSIATFLQDTHPAWGYVAAFSEAAMVGAIADWFAVTALFQRPLGLPIPHTGIIPRNKVEIGKKLSDFIVTHFLSTPQVMAKIQEFDTARRLAGWLRQPTNAEALGIHLVGIARFGIDALRDERVQQFIQRTATERLKEIDLAWVSGQLLDVMTADRRHQAMLDDVLKSIARLMKDEATQAMIARAISSELSALRYLRLDEYAGRWSAEKVVQRISDLISEISEDKDHELRARFDTYVAEFIVNLKSDPAFRLKGEQVRAQLLEHPAIAGYLHDLWNDLIDWLQNDLAREDSTIRHRLVKLTRRLGAALAADKEMRHWVNDQVLAVAPPLIERYRRRIGDYIAKRVEEWDTAELVEQIERSVGKDLQFIRINGTLVGGLVGLVLYTLSHLLMGR
ncbi:uncharacterized membrane-anchored protein YjiN (DUF445 family) [Pseudomonas duriflava]|uniref:Uncharacterized membrane-anchored protein YjiN (DUF445 family) n=2 Tax=Pseudomonas duriflava TaxID=459528 RepID=A0A562PS44_9PSED|nr:uncharacterized membrane-anchored protein YjiN (DUF445 family) [Pseudomonas duriflava]